MSGVKNQWVHPVMPIKADVRRPNPPIYMMQTIQVMSFYIIYVLLKTNLDT